MAENLIKISDFTITPGSRYKDEGKFSGEEYREKYLDIAFKKALESNSKLIIDLDGTLGYGTSWLEEVFGGLVRTGYTEKQVLEHIDFISNEEPYLIEDLIDYIKHAKK